MSEYQEGQCVRMVPSQGGHQKERSGNVVRVTAKQVVVKPSDGKAEIRFRIADGMPINKIDQQFPCYFIKPE